MKLKKVDYWNKSIKQLDNILWDWFSKFIRVRDSDEDGTVICISCGRPKVLFDEYGKFTGDIQAGHYWPKTRNYSGVKFDEKNVNGQCVQCNLHLHGNLVEYQRGLIKKYGPDVIDELDMKKRQKSKWTKFEYITLIIYYKSEAKKLAQNKGIKL